MAKIQKIGDYRILNPKWNICTAPHLPRLRDYVEEEAGRVQEPEVVYSYKQTVSSGHSKAATHELWQHAQDLYKPKPDQIRTCRGELGIKSYPLQLSYWHLLDSRRGRVSFL